MSRPVPLRVLVCAPGWSPEHTTAATRRALRARVDSLGAELTVLCARGVWSFFPGDAAPATDHEPAFGAFVDRLAGDLPTAARLLAQRPTGLAIFLVADGALERLPAGAARGEGLDPSALDPAIAELQRRRLGQAARCSARRGSSPEPLLDLTSLEPPDPEPAPRRAALPAVLVHPPSLESPLP